MAKTILVTGASSGFGRLTAQKLLASGHRVFAGFRSDIGAREEAAATLKKQGAQILSLDVTSQESVDEAIAELLKTSNGILDVVVNNAGIAAAGVSESFTPEQVREMFDVNVIGIQRILRATLPVLRKQHAGLIINIGSILGRVTLPFFGLYGASKMAVEALSESYRYELSQLGVDLVLIQPSAHPTNMYTAAIQPADSKRADAYGEIAQVPRKIVNTFVELFQSVNAPKVQDVADAVEKLVATPAGQRPERVVVGPPFGSDAVNSAVAPIQSGLIDSLGLGGLAKLKLQ